MTVVDASLLFDAIRGVPEDARSALLEAGPPLAAPYIVDLEVISAIRGFVLTGQIAEEDGRALLRRLGRLPLVRHEHQPLTSRIWELRHHLTAYAAAYVALAERLDTPLLTRDLHLSRTPGVECVIHVI